LKSARLVLLAVLVLAALAGGLYWKFSEQLPVYWTCKGKAQQTVMSADGKSLGNYSAKAEMMIERWGGVIYGITDSAFTGKYRLCPGIPGSVSLRNPMTFGYPDCAYPVVQAGQGYSRFGNFDLESGMLNLDEIRTTRGGVVVKSQAQLQCSGGGQTMNFADFVDETP
jgi:hypothetical protein